MSWPPTFLATLPRQKRELIAEAKRRGLDTEAMIQKLYDQHLELASRPLLADPFEDLDDPVKWIERNFWVPELKGPLVLAEYQKQCLREALSRDEQGNFRYSVIVWSDIKKSIKSTIAAAVCLWRAYATEWGQIVIVANDLDQADSRVGYYLRRAVLLNETMKAQVKVRNYRVELPTHTFVEAVPIDPKGEAGGNADMVCYSEMWGANSKAQQTMWTETTLSPTKFGQSFRWIESYAGYVGEAPILEQLYEQGVKRGEKIWPDTDLEAFANREARLFCLWNTKPRLEWQTPAYYAQEASALTPTEFNRVHRNEWGNSTNAFVEPEWWEACRNDQFVADMINRRLPIYLALDAGIKSDCFAIEGVSFVSGKLVHVYSKVYEPSKDKPVDFDVVMQEVVRICRIANVLEVAYDPYQLYKFASDLQKFGINTFEFKQGQDRLEADKALYDAIRHRTLVHANDPTLTLHVKNANSKGEENDKLRIIKRSESMKIDAAVALSMACYRALIPQEKPKNFGYFGIDSVKL